jgi:hypothetical protein
MTLRAADVKDEHGWQLLGDEGQLVGHATSRDWARRYAKDPSDENAIAHVTAASRDNGQPVDVIAHLGLEGEVLPADNSPEAIAGREAFAVSERIKNTVYVIKSAWMDLAADLYVFHRGKMWEALGAESWNAFFADPDIDLNPRWAYELVAVYQQLVIDRGVEPERLKSLEASKVAVVLPAIRREQVTIEQAFADVATHTKAELKLHYSGQASSTPGRPATGTRVETDHEPAWALCPTCGSRYRVNPETGERVDG